MSTPAPRDPLYCQLLEQAPVPSCCERGRCCAAAAARHTYHPASRRGRRPLSPEPPPTSSQRSAGTTVTLLLWPLTCCHSVFRLKTTLPNVMLCISPWPCERGQSVVTSGAGPAVCCAHGSCWQKSVPSPHGTTSQRCSRQPSQVVSLAAALQPSLTLELGRLDVSPARGRSAAGCAGSLDLQ